MRCKYCQYEDNVKEYFAMEEVCIECIASLEQQAEDLAWEKENEMELRL